MDSGAPARPPRPTPARGVAQAPASKSHAIRALLCAALADGVSDLAGLSRCGADDVLRAVGALRSLGFRVEGDRVTGAGGKIPSAAATLDLGGSATALRFLAAVSALGTGPTTLTGDASLRRRPMRSTAESLAALGARCRGAGDAGAPLPPLVVTREGPASRVAVVDASASSHPLSALLLAGAALPEGLAVVARGLVASRPYVDLTAWTMRQFGVEVEPTTWAEALSRAALALRAELRALEGRVPRGASVHLVPGGGYRAADVTLVGDWSSAAFLLAAAAVTRGDVEVSGLEWDSPQADRRIADLLRAFGADVERTASGVRARGGASRPLDADLGESPDLAPLVGALGCVAAGETRVRGAAHLRAKESDRIAAIVAAARALGCSAEERPDGFAIRGPATREAVVVTRGDHRIAMAFGAAGLALPGVRVDDRACVAKSFPGFWDALERLRSA